MKNNKLIDFFFVAALLFFAYAGMMKWFFVIIDPTVIFAIFCFPAILFWSGFKFYYKSNPLVQIIPTFFLFNLLMVFTSLYTISSYYYILKSLLILSNLFIFILPMLILRSERTFYYLILIFKSLFFLCLVLLTYEYVDNQLTRIRYGEVLGQSDMGLPNYLTFSYFLGGCIILLIDSTEKFVKGGLIIALLFMILLAAKGPLFFLLIVMIIKFRSRIRLANVRLWFSLVFAVSLLYIFITLTGIQLFDTLNSRLSFFSGGLDADDSSLARVLLLQKGVDLIKDNFLFGVGIGGFAKAIGDSDGRISPHNIFIEVWSETGILPITILLLICFLFFKKFRFLLKKYTFYFGDNIIYLCLFIFLSNMVSAYLEDMRITYFWLGVSIAYYTMKIKSLSKPL